MRDAIVTFVLTLIAGGLVVATALGFWFYPFVTIGVVVLWVIASVKIIGPAEMAVLVLFGVPVAPVDSGICFVPWFFGLTYLVRYPKKTYNLEFLGIEVITKAAKYGTSAQNYGALKTKVDAAVYLNFPRPDTPLGPDDDTHPLIKILRAGVPTNDSELRAWTKEAVESAVRLAMGNVTWKQAAEDIDEINQRVTNIFKDSDGVLVEAGFRDPYIKLVVSKVKLSDDVEEALTGPEKTRLAADASRKDAEAQAIDRLGTILYSIAESEGVDVGVVRERVKADKGLQNKLLEYAMKLHADIEKADRGSYFKLDSSGNPFLDVITLYKQLTGGGAPASPGGGQKTPGGKGRGRAPPIPPFNP